MSYSITAIVPMRHNSERVPSKNFRDFGGKPLFFHILESLLAVKSISSVVVDTDSPEIRDSCTEHFPKVHLINRPNHLRGGDVPMNDVLMNATAQIESDFYLQTHSTNPLLKSSTIEKGIEEFIAKYPIYDSLFAVTPRYTRFWDQLARPINHNADILLRTQDLPPVYEENSNLYIFTREILKRRHNRIGHRPLLFPMDAREAWDIDDLLDFEVAEILFSAQKSKS